jgi:alkylation response protein AidB-like acyl-CoA dehydrogenase
MTALDTEENAHWREKARAVADKVVRPVSRKYDEAQEYPWEIKDAVAEAGLLQCWIPKEYGGAGFANVDLAIAAEELMAVDVSVPTTMLGVGLGLQPLLLHGSHEQKSRLLPDFIEDPANRLAALAFSDVGGAANFDCPDPGAGMQTSARRDGDFWIINGQKQYTTNGSGWDGRGAHLYSVVCRTDMGLPPSDSLAVIMVPGSTPGIEIKGHHDMPGHRAVDSPIIHFTDVRVPAANILGQPGDGIALKYKTFSWTAGLIGAACVGVMRAAFDFAFEFTRTEKRAGSVPIIDHQNAGYMLVDMKSRIEACRYLTWKACHALDVSGGAAEELPTITKVFCSETCVQVVYDAMRLVGVDSYTSDTPLAGLMQDALCFPLYDGGNMGIRRRRLHALMRAKDYDPLAAAYG